MIESKFVDKVAIARMFNIPVSTVDYLRRKGKIPAITVGRHKRYNPEEVEKYLKGNNN